MTFGEIYTRAMWLVYGSSTPPADAGTQFQGVSEGILANLHRNIQEDFNYWFMEGSFGVPVPAYTRTVALPVDFKEECGPVRSLVFGETYDAGDASCSGTPAVTGSGTAWDVDWSGRKYQISWDNVNWYPIESVASATSLTLETNGPSYVSAPYIIRSCVGLIPLNKLYRAQDDRLSVAGAQRNPLHYMIYGDSMRLFPLPNEDGYIEYKYYKFFPRPTDFLSHTDALTENAADALVYYIASFEEKRRQNFDSAGVYEEMGDGQIQLLQNRHFSRSNANVTLPYIDF